MANLDFLVFIIIGAGVLVYGYTLGLGRLALLTISSYLALVLADSFPYQMISSLNTTANAPWEKLAVFAVFLALMYLFLPDSLLQSYVRIKSSPKGKIWKILLFSILQLGLFWAIIVSFLPEETVQGLTPALVTYFSGIFSFIWLIVPLFFWFIFRKAD